RSASPARTAGNAATSAGPTLPSLKTARFRALASGPFASASQWDTGLPPERVGCSFPQPQRRKASSPPQSSCFMIPLTLLVVQVLNHLAAGPGAEGLKGDAVRRETPIGIVAGDAAQERNMAIGKQEVGAPEMPAGEIV